MRKDIRAPDVTYAQITFMEIQKSLVAYVNGASVMTMLIWTGPEIAIQRLENVYNACTIQRETTVNIARMDSLEMLQSMIVSVNVKILC